MTTNRTVGEKYEERGKVKGRFHPGWRIAKSTGKPYLASGKLVLDTDDGECEVSFLQVYVDGERSDSLMPQIWNDIDDNIKGKEVAIACTFERTYINPTTGAVKHQFRNPTFIKYLNSGDAPPPVSAQTTQVAQTAVAPPTVAPTVGVAPVPYVDEREKKIIRQSCLKVAGSQHKREHFDTALEMRLQTRETAEWYLEWVITGENTPVADGPEKQERLFEDSDNLQGEV